MKIDFTKQKVRLVITMLDTRLSFSCLYEIALVYLHNDVKKAGTWLRLFPKNVKMPKSSVMITKA